MIRKAIIVQYQGEGTETECLKKLNDYLNNGWSIYHTQAMPSSMGSTRCYAHPTCLIILENQTKIRR